MARIYKVVPSQLVNSVLFEGWEFETLTDLITKLVPVVFPPRTTVFSAGVCGWVCARAVHVHGCVSGSPAAHRLYWRLC